MDISSNDIHLKGITAIGEMLKVRREARTYLSAPRPPARPHARTPAHPLPHPPAPG